MNRTKARARAAAAPANDQVPPTLYNIGFVAVAMMVAALALFGQ